ncbi:TOG array regulator of axonemal microtubules protein 1, partial [Sesbania bispinosa]
MDDENCERKEYDPWMRASNFGRKVVPKPHEKAGGPCDKQTNKASSSNSRDITELLAALSVSKPAC